MALLRWRVCRDVADNDLDGLQSSHVISSDQDANIKISY